jgi:hypothetical protein
MSLELAANWVLLMSEFLQPVVKLGNLVSMASWVMSMNEDVISSLEQPPAELSAIQSLVGNWQGGGLVFRPDGSETSISATLDVSVLLSGWLYRFDRRMFDFSGELLESASAVISYHQKSASLKYVEYLAQAKSFVHRSGSWQDENLVFDRDPASEMLRSRVSLRKIRPHSFSLHSHHSCDGGCRWQESHSSLSFSRI